MTTTEATRKGAEMIMNAVREAITDTIQGIDPLDKNFEAKADVLQELIDNIFNRIDEVQMKSKKD